eukprot:TRINITY_DN22849_c0_g1_i2.p1 TRINITY_DN22849_c0_g1~~TRINITY_DN22849_c0_g1_i2.p1  ORF type:complete len:589 (+),score=98.00 TRINITY_DN22849_c0_g1_i2:123-1889(+)
MRKMSLCSDLCAVQCLGTFFSRSTYFSNVNAYTSASSVSARLRVCSASSIAPPSSINSLDRYSIKANAGVPNSRRIWRRTGFEKSVISDENQLDKSSGKQISLVPWPERKAAIAALKTSVDLRGTLNRVGKKLQVEDLNLLLRYFGGIQKWEETSQIFDWMQKQDKTNAASYASFITLMGKGGQPRRGLECYQKLEEEGLKLNVVVCNAILNCLVSNKKVEIAFDLFEKMKRGGLQPNVRTYSMLIAACASIENGYHRVSKLLREFKRMGLKIDAIMYGSLMAACASNGLDIEAESYFKQMKMEGLSPNEFHYSSLLKAYAAKRKHKEADKIISEMRSAGFVPNKVVLSSLLNVYVRSGLLEQAQRLLSEMDTLGHASTEMPYTILIDGLVKAGEVKEAHNIFVKMKRKGITSDGHTYSALISAYSKSGNIDEIRKLDKELENGNEKYDLVTLNTLLRAYVRAGDMKFVVQTLKKMDANKVSPDSQTFTVLISYFCKAKLYDLAISSLQDMQSRGHQPNAAVCLSLIRALVNTGQTQKAFQIYNQLKTNGCSVSRELQEEMLNILIAEKVLNDSDRAIKASMKSISKP